MKKTIFLFFAAILCAMSVSAKVIYLKPNSNWTQANAAFWVHAWGGTGDIDLKMTPVANDPTIYEAEVGTSTSVIFLRREPSKDGSNVWDCWNRMGNLAIPADKNCCTINDGEWTQEKDDASSHVAWSTYTPSTTAPDRYLTGTLAGGWNANDVLMTYDEENEIYTHTFTSVAADEEHKFKVTDGTWSANWGGDDVSPAIDGVTKDGDGNVVFTLSVGGDVTVTFDGSHIQLSTTGSFTHVETFDYYLVGSFNSWNTADANYGMTKDGDVYKKEVTFAAATEFKVCNGSWASAWGINNLGDVKYLELEGTDNILMKEEKTFTVIFNPAENLITFDGLTVDVDAVTYDYYVIGTINGWATKDENYGMTDENADGVYEKEITLAEGDNEIKVNNGTWDEGFHWGFGALTVAYDETSDKGGNILVTLAAEKVITVIFDSNTKKITLDGLTEKAPVVLGHDYYITGSFNENNPADEAHGMTLDGTVYKATVTLAEGDNMLKVTDGTWDNTWGYGELGAAYEEVSDPNDFNNIKITLAAEKEITVIFDATAGKITFEGLTEKAPVVLGHDYYITGSFNENNPADEAHGMTLDGTVYKATVTLAEGDNKLKVTDGTWENTWGYGELGAAYEEVSDPNDYNNIKITLAAEKEITVIFDATAGKITFEGLTEKAPAVISYVLMGVNGDWTNGIALTQDPGNADQYVLENQVIIKATDAIKVVTLTDGVATDWCGNVDTWSNATYAADGDGNIVLEDGIYIFYFKKTANNIYINQTGYARNVTNKYGTICLPYAAASTTGAIFYRVAGKETGKVYLESVDALEAGVPYIFEKTASQIKVVYTGEKETTAGSANGLVGTFADNTTVPNDAYILYGGAFCTNSDPADPNKINAYRAYLDLDEVQGGVPTQMPGRRYIGMSVQGENEATGVEDIFSTDAPVKVIENGQLIIIRDGVKYNVQGQRL